MEFMNVQEVAKLFRVSVPTIYNWMAKRNNPIPFYKVENTTRFIEKDVVQWFKGER